MERQHVDRSRGACTANLQLECLHSVSGVVRGHFVQRSFRGISSSTRTSKFRMPKMGRARSGLDGRARWHGWTHLDHPHPRHTRLGTAPAAMSPLPRPSPRVAQGWLVESALPPRARPPTGFRSWPRHRRRSFSLVSRTDLEVPPGPDRVDSVLFRRLALGRVGYLRSGCSVHDHALVHFLFCTHARPTELAGRWCRHPSPRCSHRRNPYDGRKLAQQSPRVSRVSTTWSLPGPSGSGLSLHPNAGVLRTRVERAASVTAAATPRHYTRSARR